MELLQSFRGDNHDAVIENWHWTVAVVDVA